MLARTPATRASVSLLQHRSSVSPVQVLARAGGLLGPGGVTRTPARTFFLHEYQSMALMQKFGVDTLKGHVAKSVEEAEKIANVMGGDGKDMVVKAQAFTGGRGKGVFSNGYASGVHTCTTTQEVVEAVRGMLGHRLITKQTGPAGKPVNAVFITERLFLRREAYFAILMDRASQGPMMMGSPQGGMDIEQVAKQSPDKIFTDPIDIFNGMTQLQADRMAARLGFEGKDANAQAARIFLKLYDLFIAKDCTMVEVNPLAETHDRRVLCVDAKLLFDANADFRQKDIFSVNDVSQSDPREVAASEVGITYIGLDGDIGCLVNGAGLAMATMDVIKLKGGNPANFLDLGGGASEKQVTEAFKLLNSDKNVKSIFVNIFGGIMRCDIIALGLIRAVTELGLKKPVVVRLAGTNVEQAMQLIEDSGLRMLTAKNMDDGAEKVVRMTDIVRMAQAIDVKVSFELPL